MAIALVKSAKGISATAITAPAFGSATTSGNLVVLCFASDDYNGTPDTGWTQSTGLEQQTQHGSYLWWRISAGETSYQYTIGSATNSAWLLMEFSGVAASPYDISNGQFAAPPGATTYATPSIIPTTGNRLLVASSGMSNPTNLSAATVTYDNSFTLVDKNGNATGTTRDFIGGAYRLVTGDGSTGFTTTATFSISPNSASGLIAAFKESALSAANVTTGTQTTLAATQAGTIVTATTGLPGGGTGGTAYWEQDRGLELSRKRRKKWLQERDRRIRDL
jgi:hypothetical protein